MSRYLDKYRVGDVKYLVYYYRGKILVRKGYYNGNIFVRKDIENWHTGIPAEMQIKKGKILVSNKEDIPKAKQMVYEYELERIKEIENNAIASLLGIQKMINEEIPIK